MLTEYRDFEIHVQPCQGDGFPLFVRGPGGEARGVLRLPTAEDAYHLLIRRLMDLDTDEPLLTQLGHRLFELLFQGQIKEVLARSQGMLSDTQGLRIKLTIAETEREVAVLPWEFIVDPDQGPLAMLDSPIVRYLPQPQRIPLLKTSLPLKILLTGAQTPPQPDVERELREVQAALASLQGQVQITIEPHLTVDKLQMLLRTGVDVWHFIGHGSLSHDGATGTLLFEDAEGDAHAISALQLGVLLQRSGLKLVTLDACNSARLVTESFHSIAPALIRAQVPAVVAMQFLMPQDSTRTFARAFYSALTEGLPIDACLTEGRRAVMVAFGLRQPDWGIPVVYMRSPDGKLFDLPTAILARQLPRLDPKVQIFISYKRDTDVDEPLTRRLFDAFTQAGARVFIDQKMKVGVVWAREIERQIEASDYMVVLLSQASVQSEMVAKEVEYAYEYHQRTGKARLLPVRLNYAGPLPYQLSHYLDALHYAMWQGHADTDRLIEQLFDAISDNITLPITPQPVPLSSSDELLHQGPPPYADPRFIESLIAPGGSVEIDSEIYIEREGDQQLQRELGKVAGTTITIRAPRQTGKTSLLIRGLEQAKRQGQQVVALDLQAVQTSALQTIDTFLYYCATKLVTRLHLDRKEVERAWQDSLYATDKISYLLEDYILPHVDAKILFAIDEADRLLQTDYHNDLFGLLRSWHNSRASSALWKRLSLVMNISTEPHLLISDVTQSPFNVGSQIGLNDFSPAQVVKLNRRYRSPARDHELPGLFDYLGGHPFLTSKALYTMVNEQIGWEQVVRVAVSPASLFGDHLQRYLWLLRDQPALREALKQIMSHGRCPNEDAFYRLSQAGLVRGADSHACEYRCQLYRDFLKDKL